MRMTNGVRAGFVIALVSLALGVGIFRVDTYKSVAPCFNMPACNSAMSGQLKVTRNGFPTVYRQTASYTPTASSAFANASVEQQALSWLYILTNAIFWFAVLSSGYSVVQKLIGNKQTRAGEVVPAATTKKQA